LSWTEGICCSSVVAMDFASRAQPGGLRGLKPSPLSQVKVEKNDNKFKFLANFVHTTRSCAYNPIKMLLQHDHTFPVIQFCCILARRGAIFVQILDNFEFFASWWFEVAWFGQFVVLQINYDAIKLQKYQLWRHFGDVIKITSPKLRHQNDTKIFDFQAPLLAKSWLCPCSTSWTLFSAQKCSQVYLVQTRYGAKIDDRWWSRLVFMCWTFE